MQRLATLALAVLMATVAACDKDRPAATGAGFTIHRVELNSVIPAIHTGDIETSGEPWQGKALRADYASYTRGPDRARLAAFVESSLSDPYSRLPEEFRLLLGPVDDPPGPPGWWRTYLAHREPLLTDADVRAVRLDVDPISSRPRVVIEVSDADLLARITRANVGRKIAIVVDGDVVLAPLVHQSVADGSLKIDFGRGTLATVEGRARDLYQRLRRALGRPNRAGEHPH